MQSPPGAIDLRGLKERASKEGQAAPAALTPREQRWSVGYEAPSGQTLSATLVSRIASGDERIQIARMAADLAACPWQRLPPNQAARIWAMATLTVQLRDPPEWVLEWAQEDDSLLFSLFQQAAEHESLYFHGDVGEGAEDTQQRRLALSVINAT